MNFPMTTVPQANPGAGYRALKSQIDAAIARVLASGWYVLGEEGRGFEAEFAAWLGTSYAVGCANGTDALALALRALGVGAGAAVATVSHTAVATVAAIEMAGATPVLLDIEPDHYTMDPAELATLMASPPPGLPPIRAVIPVHLYGQPADLGPISAICAEHRVMLIEDCSQAHGATLGGNRVGTFGDVAAFSLYPTKNLGALGDGGILATGDAAMASRLTALRQYGWRTPTISEAVGVNSRLDELQAAVLRAKLPHLDAQNMRRRQIAALYDEAIADGPWLAPTRRPGSEHVFHQYVVRVQDRAAMQAKLRGMGIGTGVHYSMPVHLQPAYLGRVALGPAHCAATEQAAGEVMSLPIYPELSDREVTRVCQALRTC